MIVVKIPTEKKKKVQCKLDKKKVMLEDIDYQSMFSSKLTSLTFFFNFKKLLKFASSQKDN